MRTIVNLNKDWLFVKDTTDISLREGEAVSLPHSWNAVDGQDGGNDYFRGSCLYVKTIDKAELPKADLYYLEFRGTNSSADLFVGGNQLAHHDGGYSTWRVNITDAIVDKTDIALIVDNTANDVHSGGCSYRNCVYGMALLQNANLKCGGALFKAKRTVKNLPKRYFCTFRQKKR